MPASSRWERVKAAVAEAAELPPEGRAALLDRLAAEDAALAEEVASLLAGHDRAEALMAEPTFWAGGTTLPPDDGRLPGSVGRYRVTGLLGRGGMGEVYRAHDPQLDRDVALKLLPIDLAAHPVRRARFLREARAAASLNHPSITTIHEIGEADTRDYIAFELVEGRTLHAILREQSLGLEELVDIAVPLADALAYAHERGVVHRDIKAANVMVTARGLPKLVDFGLAKLTSTSGAAGDDARPAPGPPPSGAAERTVTDDGSTLTVGGRIFGTPGAMSPEQALGRPVDARSDVFSFGSLLYEMACGRPAFPGSTAAGILQAVIHAEPEPLRELRPDLPQELVDIVDRALRKSPDDRYQHVADMAADLRAFQRKTQSGLHPPAAAAARSRARRFALAASFALALAAGLWTWMYPTPAERLTGVMYFDNVSDPDDVDQLGSMLAWRLTTNLAAAGGLPMVSQQRLYDVARREGRGDGRIDRASATAVAGAAGVTTMVLGQVAQAGERIVATAELVDVASGRSLGAPRVYGADAGSILEMADELAWQVHALLRTPDMSPTEKRALSQQLTTSVDAWRAYVRGEKLLERRRIDEAVAAFDEAVAIDPSFALAHYSNHMTLTWTGDEERSMRSLERALAFREKLPPAERRLLDATRPYWGNDRMSQALPTLLELLEEDPYQDDVLFLLGDIYTHSAVMNHSRRAAEVYGRMLEADPDFSLVYEHLFNAYLRMGNWELAGERLRDWHDRAPDVIAGLDGVLALWQGRLEEAGERMPDPLWPDLLAGRLDAPSVTAIASRPLSDILAGVEPLKGAYLVMALNDRAAVLAYVGRLGEAVELLRRAYDVPPYTNSPDGFSTSLRMLSQHKLAYLLELRGDLAGAHAIAAAPLAIQPESPRCLYAAVAFAARAGDVEAARRHARRLSELCRRERITPSATLYRDAAAAELALVQGDPEQARELYRDVVSSGRLMEDWYAFMDSAGPMFRDGLVRACLAAGDASGAALALDGLIGCGYERAQHPVLWVQALATRGLMQLDSGRHGSGRELLQRVLAHWGDADWELPVVAAARSRLGE